MGKESSPGCAPLPLPQWSRGSGGSPKDPSALNSSPQFSQPGGRCCSTATPRCSHLDWRHGPSAAPVSSDLEGMHFPATAPAPRHHKGRNCSHIAATWDGGTAPLQPSTPATWRGGTDQEKLPLPATTMRGAAPLQPSHCSHLECRHCLSAALISSDLDGRSCPAAAPSPSHYPATTMRGAAPLQPSHCSHRKWRHCFQQPPFPATWTGGAARLQLPPPATTQLPQ